MVSLVSGVGICRANLAVVRFQSDGQVIPSGRDLALAARYAAEARPRIPADDHYNPACLESVCGNVDAALAHLRRAAGDPDFNRDWARRDPDFEWIRDDLRFGEFSA